MSQTLCETCGAPLPSRWRHYCSDRCRQDARDRRYAKPDDPDFLECGGGVRVLRKPVVDDDWPPDPDPS